MVILTPHRTRVCREFLQECYAGWNGTDLQSTGNTVETYSNDERQLAYSVMYFAKYVACWATVRELVEPPGSLPSKHLVSLGAGPMFCLMGWFFDHPPTAETVTAVDILSWSGVRQLPSHQALVNDVFGTVVASYRPHLYIPNKKPPQCSGKQQSSPLDLASLPTGSTVLMPMLLNHLLGATAPLVVGDLAPWFRELEQRAGKIVIVDLASDSPGTEAFWGSVRQLVRLSGNVPVLSFEASSAKFGVCYPETRITSVPESRRRTGIQYPNFAKVSGCRFDQGRGWRWLERHPR